MPRRLAYYAPAFERLSHCERHCSCPFKPNKQLPSARDISDAVRRMICSMRTMPLARIAVKLCSAASWRMNRRLQVQAVDRSTGRGSRFGAFSQPGGARRIKARRNCAPPHIKSRKIAANAFIGLEERCEQSFARRIVARPFSERSYGRFRRLAVGPPAPPFQRYRGIVVGAAHPDPLFGHRTILERSIHVASYGTGRREFNSGEWLDAANRARRPGWRPRSFRLHGSPSRSCRP
jgi:hypothetical protein